MRNIFSCLLLYVVFYSLTPMLKRLPELELWQSLRYFYSGLSLKALYYRRSLLSFLADEPGVQVVEHKYRDNDVQQ